MKTQQADANIAPCKCPNQFLLPPNAKCNLCDGIVTQTEHKVSQPTPEDIFDEFYFEELETFYEDLEYHG